MTVRETFESKIGEIIDELQERLAIYDDHFISLDVDGTPVAIVITPEAFEQFRELRRARWERLFETEEDPFALMSPEEIDSFTREEVDAVRERHYQERRQFG